MILILLKLFYIPFPVSDFFPSISPLLCREENAYYCIVVIVCCCYSYRVTEPDDLVALQDQEWGPLVEWFNKR